MLLQRLARHKSRTKLDEAPGVLEAENRLASAVAAIEDDLAREGADLSQWIRQASSAGEATIDAMCAIDGRVSRLQEAARSGSASAADATSVMAKLLDSSREIEGQAALSSRVAMEVDASVKQAVEEVRRLEAAVEQILEVVGVIERIAGQTNLLALNATIEAARAGEAGRGFAVVASEVKALAGQTQDLTARAQEQIEAVTLASGCTKRVVDTIAARVNEMDEAARAVALSATNQQQANRTVSASASRMTELAASVAETVEHVATDFADTQRQGLVMHQKMAAAASAAAKFRGTIKMSLWQALGDDRRRQVRVPTEVPAVLRWRGQQVETVTIDLSPDGAQVCLRNVKNSPPLGCDVDLGLEGIGALQARVVGVTQCVAHLAVHSADAAVRDAHAKHLAKVNAEDDRFVAIATKQKDLMVSAIEQALKQGQLAAEELEDVHYRIVEGTDPVQFTTRYLERFEEILPPLQEQALREDERIVFCALVDRNGYLPVHNKAFSQPQRPGERAWNTANSRNRRMFDDKAGFAAARNTKPRYIQSYSRDMGGGKFVTLKEADVPVVLCGKHWGAVRLCYKP